MELSNVLQMLFSDLADAFQALLLGFFQALLSLFGLGA